MKFNELSEQAKVNAIENYIEFMAETSDIRKDEFDKDEVKEIIIYNCEQFNEKGELV